jgi:hypothetical protein
MHDEALPDVEMIFSVDAAIAHHSASTTHLATWFVLLDVITSIGARYSSTGTAHTTVLEAE